MNNKRLINYLTWKEYQSVLADKLLIIPFGSTEQHGLHLPVSVDSIISQGFSLKIAEQADGYVAPVISYGYKSQPNSGGGPFFPGTIDLSLGTLTSLAREIIQEFMRDGWKNILILNGHFENLPSLQEAAEQACSAFGDALPKIMLTSWWDHVSDEVLKQVFQEVPFPGWELEHAGIAETSLMLYFEPELVNEEQIASHIGMTQLPSYQVFPANEDDIPETGCLYTDYSSNSRKGNLIVESVVSSICKVLSEEGMV